MSDTFGNAATFFVTLGVFVVAAIVVDRWVERNVPIEDEDDEDGEAR